MKSLIIAALASVILSAGASSQTTTAVTPEMQAMEAKLLTHVGPETRTWIKQQAAKQKAAATYSDQLDQQTLSSYPYASTLAQSDIDALMFLVMMEASRTGNEELKASLDAMRKTSAAKAAVRQSKSEIRKAQNRQLQMEMDSRSKFTSTLSNLMKKMSETNSTIVQNLK